MTAAAAAAASKKPEKAPTIFPVGPIEIGRVAQAKLVQVVREPKHIVGRYVLSPKDAGEFVDMVSRLKGHLGRRYAVLPGTWATFVVPEDKDEVELHVGLEHRYGKAMLGAKRTLKIPGDSIVSDLTVRMAALGYLRCAGVTR